METGSHDPRAVHCAEGTQTAAEFQSFRCQEDLHATARTLPVEMMDETSSFFTFKPLLDLSFSNYSK